jgi:hypothetical protein
MKVKNKKTGVVWDVQDASIIKRVKKHPDDYEILPDEVIEEIPPEDDDQSDETPPEVVEPDKKKK